MANTSIFAAFERMWHHVVLALSGKSDVSHLHDDRYYTEDEIDTKLAEKSDSSHNHNSAYDTKGAAGTALDEAKSYTDDAVDGLASITVVDTKITTHNTATDSHNDIRNIIDGLTTRLNALANSDDTTLDQLAEIVEYIKSNRSLIEEVTTNKVNVDDIIDNLTTNVANKPLSAAQGVALKALIDAIEVPVDSVNGKTGAVVLIASDVGATTETYVDGKMEEAKTYADENKSAVEIVRW